VEQGPFIDGLEPQSCNTDWSLHSANVSPCLHIHCFYILNREGPYETIMNLIEANAIEVGIGVSSQLYCQELKCST